MCSSYLNVVDFSYNPIKNRITRILYTKKASQFPARLFVFEYLFSNYCICIRNRGKG
jgi:hypothetical protein